MMTEKTALNEILAFLVKGATFILVSPFLLIPGPFAKELWLSPKSILTIEEMHERTRTPTV